MCMYACVYSYACGGHWSTSSIVLQEIVTLFLRDEVSHWVVELTCWLRRLFTNPKDPPSLPLLELQLHAIYFLLLCGFS